YQLALHAHGIDFSPVKAQRKRKSIGRENTYLPVLIDQNEILRNLRNFAEGISKQLKEKKLQGKVVTIMVRTRDFVTKTKRQTLPKFTSDEQVI
ncbi:DinB/UmuC family translesion DNA polymerase, partial [Lactobacillus jensenii]|uniref:DinB/UmuC family translesion DNA polymerase n=1 Tax=Lactobacillus jensenii TaxID=109790 RepID=UPI004045B315